FFFLTPTRPPPRPPLFPYTTLFRSELARAQTTAKVVLTCRAGNHNRTKAKIHFSDLVEYHIGPLNTGHVETYFKNRGLGSRHPQDRKSTRLNSSHVKISYAVFCLKK